MTVERAQWIPVRVTLRDGDPAITWLAAGDSAFSEPSLKQTIHAQLQRGNAATMTTYLDASEPAFDPSAEPAGFIFHVSRCGSTLVSQLLKQIPGVRVYAEPRAINEALHLGEQLSHSELRWLVEKIVRGFCSGSPAETRVVFKLSSWNLFAWQLFDEIFPSVPKLFVIRHPLEVLVSIAKHPPGFVRLRRGTDTLDDAEYASQFLAMLFDQTKAALHADMGGGSKRLVDYSELPSAAWSMIPQLFGSQPSGADVSRMESVARYHAKSIPPVPFVREDAANHADEASLSRYIKTWIGSRYDDLRTPATHHGPATANVARRYVISKFAIASWAGGHMQLTSPVTRTTLTSSDPALLRVLSAFAVPRPIDDVVQELSPHDVAKVIDDWIAAAILVDAGEPEPAARSHWDRDALALHASSRARGLRKTRGHATPAVAPRRSQETIPLAPYDAARTPGDLASLLDTRRSRRNWSDNPIGLQAFSDLFWLSARNRATRERAVTRPYPSGGAAYSLELYPVLGDDAVDTLLTGVYRYLPEAHALELVSPFDVDAEPFLVSAGHSAMTSPPPMVILITSRYARQSEEYGRLAYSLVLKEVGCLFQTFYLAAESLGLAACALGGGSPAGLLAELCGTTELEEPVVGEFAIGAAAD